MPEPEDAYFKKERRFGIFDFPENEPLKIEDFYLENEIRLVPVDHPLEHGRMCQFIAAGQHSSNHFVASRCLKRDELVNFKISYEVVFRKKKYISFQNSVFSLIQGEFLRSPLRK